MIIPYSDSDDFSDLWDSESSEDLPERNKKEEIIKCECGSEKTYGEDTTHSDWCAKGGEDDELDGQKQWWI